MEITSMKTCLSLLLIPCFVKSHNFRLSKHISAALYSIDSKGVDIKMSQKRKIEENDNNFNDEVTRINNDEVKLKSKTTKIITERTSIQTQSSSNDSYCRIISWNVAGLRGVLKKNCNIINDLVEVLHMHTNILYTYIHSSFIVIIYTLNRFLMYGCIRNIILKLFVYKKQEFKSPMNLNYTILLRDMTAFGPHPLSRKDMQER
jgi:hypothetical protein